MTGYGIWAPPRRGRRRARHLPRHGRSRADDRQRHHPAADRRRRHRFRRLINVRETVRGYEAAGVRRSRSRTRRCRRSAATRPAAASWRSRRRAPHRGGRGCAASDDFLIIARTDARTSQGLAAALERGKAFAQGRRRIVFIEAPESEAEFAQVGAALRGDAWLFANMVPSGNSPVVSAENLQRYGFSIVDLPDRRHERRVRSARGCLPASRAARQHRGLARAKLLDEAVASARRFPRGVGIREAVP